MGTSGGAEGCADALAEQRTSCVRGMRPKHKGNRRVAHSTAAQSRAFARMHERDELQHELLRGQSAYADVGDGAVLEPDEADAVADGDDAAVAAALRTHAKVRRLNDRPQYRQCFLSTWPRGAHRHVGHRTGDERDRDVAARDGHDARTLCAPERSRSSGDRRHTKARGCTASRATGRLAAQRTLTRLISLNSTRTSFPDTSSAPAMPKSSAVAPAAG